VGIYDDPIQLPQQATAPDDEIDELPSIVRAYAWTGGRAQVRKELEIETLVSVTEYAMAQLEALSSEHESVARLCHSTISVAEISALLALPLGVVRVLLDDMATLGLVDVHHNVSTIDERPGMDLLERVRRGLVNLDA
jgi:hypothetical protein